MKNHMIKTTKISLYIKKVFPNNSVSNICLLFRSHRIVLHECLYGKSQRKILVLSIKSKRFIPCIFKRQICKIFKK